jgi:hypothetical protein
VSLNWDLRSAAIRREHAGDLGKLPEWPVVETIMMMTPVIGIGEFTDKNINEVVARFRYYEALHGHVLTTRGKGIPIPEKIIRSLVGLKTNVGLETRGKWQKRMADLFFRQSLREGR